MGGYDDNVACGAGHSATITLFLAPIKAGAPPNRSGLFFLLSDERGLPQTGAQTVQYPLYPCWTGCERFLFAIDGYNDTATSWGRIPITYYPSTPLRPELEPAFPPASFLASGPPWTAFVPWRGYPSSTGDRLFCGFKHKAWGTLGPAPFLGPENTLFLSPALCLLSGAWGCPRTGAERPGRGRVLDGTTARC